MGHTLGAAGALEAIVTALSVVNSVVPPTVGFAEADPECAVCVSAEPVRDYPQKVALSNSLGFGGHNASVAISLMSNKEETMKALPTFPCGKEGIEALLPHRDPFLWVSRILEFASLASQS